MKKVGHMFVAWFVIWLLITIYSQVTLTGYLNGCPTVGEMANSADQQVAEWMMEIMPKTADKAGTAAEAQRGEQALESATESNASQTHEPVILSDKVLSGALSYYDIEFSVEQQPSDEVTIHIKNGSDDHDLLLGFGVQGSVVLKTSAGIYVAEPPVGYRVGMGQSDDLVLKFSGVEGDFKTITIKEIYLTEHNSLMETSQGLRARNRTEGKAVIQLSE